MEIDKTLLKRYSAGNCSPEEEKAVEEWLFDSGDVPGIAHPEKNEAHLKDIWNHIVRKTRIRDSPLPKNRYGLKVAATAACLVVLLSAGWLNRTYLYLPFVKQEQMAVNYGKQGNMTLKDGSTIHLRAGTLLTYPSFFAGNTREVFLEKGEAFFHVSKDPSHPFIVHTDSVEIKVLGTRFNVSNVENSSRIYISLTEGKIQFDSGGKKIMLAPGQQLIYDKRSKEVSLVSGMDADYVTAWTRGELWFKDTPLSEVFNILERHYGIPFIPEKEWDLPFTARFGKQSLQRTLYLLEKSTKLDFERKENRVLITEN
ncbi:FecR family protein [Sinomicrobium soli]|uniref:FecR family protein n=1 Tax=Sinomicrobium sp. N-1-3-6 TaxID=2219864 RepID=UPI001374EEFA|nr:FecR family protein [Sinomicrobium sp. N-1-3-6]